MKKLIDELEAMARKLFRNPNANDDTCKGFDHALQIVRAHNPWHEVTELPPKVESKVYSIEVNVTDGNEVRLGMYDYELNRWFIRGYRPAAVYFNPTHWAYLPELPK